MPQENKLKTVFAHARENNYAIGQFNFSTLDQLQAIIMAAKDTNVAVICGTSPGEASFFGIEEAVSLVKIARERDNVSVFLNLDHGKDLQEIKRAIDAGYDMVHFDGSSLPIEDNTKNAIDIVSYAHSKGVLVEGEIAQIKGSSTISNDKIGDLVLTSVQKIAKFIEESGVDCIALDVGNVHGIYKNEPIIYPERVNELLSIVSCFVVLHGGSGIPKDEIYKLINNGIVKININTELRVAWRDAVYETLINNKKQVTPYKILPLAKEAVYKKVIDKINIFNNKQ